MTPGPGTRPGRQSERPFHSEGCFTDFTVKSCSSFTATLFYSVYRALQCILLCFTVFTFFYSLFYSTLQPILQCRKRRTCLSFYSFYSFYSQPSVCSGVWGAPMCAINMVCAWPVCAFYVHAICMMCACPACAWCVPGVCLVCAWHAHTLFFLTPCWSSPMSGRDEYP